MKNFNLAFLSILFLFASCRSESDLVETERKTKEASGKFSIFFKNSPYAKNAFSLDYAKSFAYLAERYDSINKTNVTGLVNTPNKVTYSKISKHRFISQASDFYIEFRLHSQAIFEDNGDIWILFPKIKNGKVIDLVATLLTEYGTKVYYPTINRNSLLFTEHVSLFQSQFSKHFIKDEKGNVFRVSTTARCGFDGYAPCDIEEVIISPPPIDVRGSSGGGIIGAGNPPGGGCKPHEMCLDDGNGGGGGSSMSTSDPCTQASAPSAVATSNSTTSAFLNSKTAINNMNNGLENGVVLGNVNNSIQPTSVQTGSSSSISLTHSFSDPVADLHNHQNNKPPSHGDVYSLITNRSNFVNYNTRYVITSNGITYALIVTDPNAMAVFLQNYPPVQYQAGTSPNFPGQLFEDWYNFTFDGLGNDEMALAYVLDKYNSGVALTKMNSDGSFKKINVNANTINGSIVYTQSNCP